MTMNALSITLVTKAFALYGFARLSRLQVCVYWWNLRSGWSSAFRLGRLPRMTPHVIALILAFHTFWNRKSIRTMLSLKEVILLLSMKSLRLNLGGSR